MTSHNASKQPQKLEFPAEWMGTDAGQSHALAEAAFVKRLQQGEQEAWSHFVNDYGVRLNKYLEAQLPTLDDVNDVLSDTLMAIVRAIRTFDHKIPLATFVYQLMHQTVAEYWRRRANYPRSWVATLATTQKPPASWQHPISRLPEALQHVLLLRYHVGYSIDEIATLVGKSYQETETLLQQARRQLQTSWEATAMHDLTYGGERGLLQSVLQMLQTQYGKCATHNMAEEALLFQRAIRHLQRLMDEYPVRELS